MDLDSLYCKLDRLRELESELSKKDVQLEDKRLVEYAHILSSLRMISPEELVEYHACIALKDEEFIKAGIKNYRIRLNDQLGNYMRGVKSLLKIKTVGDKLDEDPLDLIKQGVESMKEKLLRRLEEKCSDSAYEDLRKTVEDVFSKT